MGFVVAAQKPRQAFGTVKSRVQRIISGTARSGRNNADAEYPSTSSADKIDKFTFCVGFTYKNKTAPFSTNGIGCYSFINFIISHTSQSRA